MAEPEQVDIVRNIKLIEGLKVQLLSVVAGLFEGLYRGAEEQVLDALSAAVVIIFNIANRVGIGLRRLDAAVAAKLEERVKQPNNSLRQCEQELLEYWQRRG